MERSAADPKSKADASRAAATLWGVMAEMGFGTVLVIWFSDPESTDHIPFGRVASIAAVIAAMGITLIGLLAVRLLHKRSDVVRRRTAYPLFFIAPIVGCLTIMSIFVDYSGPWVLLVVGTVGTYIVARHLAHTKVQADPGEGVEA